MYQSLRIAIVSVSRARFQQTSMASTFNHRPKKSETRGRQRIPRSRPGKTPFEFCTAISISPFPSGSFVKYVPTLPNPHPSISPVATLCRFSGGRGEQHSLFLYLLRPEGRTACNSRLFVQLLTSFRSGCSWRGESLRLSKRISALPRRNV